MTLVVLDAEGSLPTRLVVPIALSQDGTPPTEFRLFSAGLNVSTKGIFNFTRQAATEVIAEFKARGVEKPADYNHGSIPQKLDGGGVRPPTAEEGKAAARYQLELRDTEAGPELWAVDVRWTPQADSYIRAKEYFATSNAFLHDADGVVRQFVNFALTNNPAMFNQPALVAASADPTAAPAAPRSPTMDKIKQCMAALEAATDDAGKAAAMKALADAIAEMAPPAEKEKAAELAALSGGVVAITGKQKSVEQLAVLTAFKQASERVEALSAEVATLKGGAAVSKFDAVLDQGARDGKLTPADLKGDTAAGKYIATLRGDQVNGVVALSAFVGAMPKQVAAEVKQPTAPAAGADLTQLSSTEAASIDALFGRAPGELEKK